jgi:hypothetical protein
VKISFGELIDVREVSPREADREVVYERLTTLQKQRIQQMLDAMRHQHI